MGKGNWWKPRMAALRTLHVLTFRMRWPQAPDEAPKGIKIMNRLFSTTLATALLLAGPVLAATDTKAKKEPTAAQLVARERMGKCSIEWKEAKAGGKIDKGTKWPQFWSACNKRLKGGTSA